MMPDQERSGKLYRDGDDEHIWKELKTGSKVAFDFIYNSYVNDLFRYGSQIVTDRDLLYDVIHDIFVNLWEKREKLSDVHSIKFYLLVTLKRMLVRKIKKEKKLFIGQETSKNDFEIVPSYLEEIIRNYDEEKLRQKIGDVLGELTERQREIIYLKFYQNLSYHQISELLDIDQKYTYNLAARAFHSFKEKFSLLGDFIIIILFLV